MPAPARHWTIDDPATRSVIAAIAVTICIASLMTRDTPALDWPLLTPTIGLYALWAVIGQRLRWPMYAFGIGVPLILNLVDSEKETSMFLMVLTVGVIAAVEPWRRGVGLLTATVIVAMVALAVTGALGSFAWPNWVFGLLFSSACGAIVFRYAATIEELQRTRAVLASQAAAHERRRIARDVHDLVGHSLSVVLLHLTGARHLVHRDPDEAKRALEQAETAGRASLEEIRRTIGLLRDDDDDARALPSPELTDVDVLVDDFARAGMTVTYQADGPFDDVDSAIGLAGYRIVQEALTNASRHTEASSVTVSVRVAATSCEVSVVNQGGRPATAGTDAGFGLIGMRERARSVGGSLTAGPTSDGWSVKATLPRHRAVTAR